MTGLPFWTGQIIYDVLISLILLLFSALGVVATRIPHFFLRLSNAVLYGQERVFLARMPRYISYRLFVFIGRIQSTLLLSICCFLILDDKGQLTDFDLWESLFSWLCSSSCSVLSFGCGGCFMPCGAISLPIVRLR